MGAPTRRRWIKLYPVECLDGSIRFQLSSEERGVWYDLLNFAAICTNSGTISDRDGRPLPHSFIANRLNIPLSLLKKTITKCIDEGRLIEDISGIHISNWSVYQSEYERQKIYRQKPRAGQKITTYTQEMFDEDDAYIDNLLDTLDEGKEKTLIYTNTVFRAKYGQEKAIEYWPQYLIYMEKD